MPKTELEMTPEQRARYIMLAEPERMERLIAQEITEAIRELLGRLGTSAVCQTCGACIYWLATVNGRRRSPYSSDGTPHTWRCDMQDRPRTKLGRWQTG